MESQCQKDKHRYFWNQSLKSIYHNTGWRLIALFQPEFAVRIECLQSYFTEIMQN